MMQKVFLFLLITWNSSSFASVNTGTYDLLFLLGSQAVIPCQLKRGDSYSLKWYYKKGEHGEKIIIFFQDEAGKSFRDDQSRPRSVTYNASLVISCFKEDDQGFYFCESCYKGHCEQSTVIRVNKATLNEIHETLYVTAGKSFTHACPGEFSNLEWTFEAINTPAASAAISSERSEIHFLTSNKSLQFAHVERENAGKYSCWMKTCDGHRHKLLIINLCVITVHQSGNSSFPCTMLCDKEFGNNKYNYISHEKTDTRTISIQVDQYGSLNCSAKQIFDVRVTTSNNTHTLSNTSNKTADTSAKQQEYLTPVIGTLAALACLILMALLIFYLKSRSHRSDFYSGASCCGTGGREEESVVVYSSIVIRRPTETTSYHKPYRDCVYSEIRV